MPQPLSPKVLFSLPAAKRKRGGLWREGVGIERRRLANALPRQKDGRQLRARNTRRPRRPFRPEPHGGLLSSRALPPCLRPVFLVVVLSL